MERSPRAGAPGLGATIAGATVATLVAGAAFAPSAHALAACTAAQVSAQDPQCPAGTGPCNVSRVFEIGDGCTLDFGARHVTVLGSGVIDVLSNRATLRAASLTVAPGGRVEGRGNLSTPPRDRGGFLTVRTTGAVNIQRSGASRGVVDFSGNARAGGITCEAGGAITVNGDVLANNLSAAGGDGTIALRAGGDVITGPSSTLSATGGEQSAGGFIEIVAAGRVDLGTALDVRGGEGGSVDVVAGGEAIVRGISATGGGDAGSGGYASVIAGTRVQMLGPVVLNGTGSPTLSGGGDGGYLDIESSFGDVTLAAPITAESGAPDGGGGGVGIVARGSIVQGSAAPISVQGIGQSSDGGDISLEADLDVTLGAALNASGGFGGNLIDVIAGRHVTVNGMVDARGRDIGGFGGAATIVAGTGGAGNVVVNAAVDVGGGGCGPSLGCGLGGLVELSGCNVTVASTGSLLARGADGGDNLLTARELLRIQGPVDATTTLGMANGTNTLQHPSRVPPQVSAAVTPAPSVTALATCAAVGQTGCLVPCPTCGNGMVEFPETCDQAGTPVSCDGCSVFCRAENCNDGNVCTTDSCDATLGCRNQPTNEGGSCSDGNVCNGTETCSAGVCRASGPPLVCNDQNVCTSDSCHPTLGCQTTPLPAGTLCSDGNACTLADSCNGMGACTPGAPRVCTDGLPCTEDTCNPATGCVFPPLPNGTACEDGAFCTAGDTCQSGACMSGSPRACDDSDSCTSDLCDEAADACVHEQTGSCCGDGDPDPGEECDDGNDSNEDACLNTCVPATCGDGFVRTGVEQCDAGAQNANAPNAACRPGCTLPRCGDGVVDDQSGEQCDDGGTADGDGCSARCFAEPPPTAELVPGRGKASTDCALEWAYDRPAVDRRGVPSVKQACRDGDAACDRGTTPGECTFFVWLCANNTDPRLPTCAPGAGGVGLAARVDVRKPSARDASLRPVDAANRLALGRGAAAAETPEPGRCGPRMAIRVPLRATGKKGVKALKLVGTTDANVGDADILRLYCTP